MFDLRNTQGKMFFEDLLKLGLRLAIYFLIGMLVLFTAVGIEKKIVGDDRKDSGGVYLVKPGGFFSAYTVEQSKRVNTPLVGN